MGAEGPGGDTRLLATLKKRIAQCFLRPPPTVPFQDRGKELFKLATKYTKIGLEVKICHRRGSADTGFLLHTSFFE